MTKGVRTAESSNKKFKEKYKKLAESSVIQREISQGNNEIAVPTDEEKKIRRKLTWEDAVQNFIMEKQTVSRCDIITLNQYLTHLRLFRAFISNVQGITRPDLASIKREDVAKFIQYMLEDVGRSINTVNHYITSIKVFYNTLVEGKYIKENPFANIKKLVVPQKDYPSFNDEQINLLLRQPDHREWRGVRDHALLLLLSDTGCRISEALLMEMKDIRFDEKTSLPVEVVFRMTKKRKEMRAVGLSEELSQALQKWLHLRNNMQLKPKWEGDVQRHRSYHTPLRPLKRADYVFTNDIGKMLSRNTWRNRLKMYCVMCGLPEEIAWTSHCLRHSYGKISLENGMDVVSVQETMGHSTLEMVSHYAKSVGKELRDKQRNLAPSTLRNKKRGW